jgi:hypothetical protein
MAAMKKVIPATRAASVSQAQAMTARVKKAMQASQAKTG